MESVLVHRGKGDYEVTNKEHNEISKLVGRLEAVTDMQEKRGDRFSEDIRRIDSEGPLKCAVGEGLWKRVNELGKDVASFPQVVEEKVESAVAKAMDSTLVPLSCGNLFKVKVPASQVMVVIMSLIFAAASICFAIVMTRQIDEVKGLLPDVGNTETVNNERTTDTDSPRMGS